MKEQDDTSPAADEQGVTITEEEPSAPAVPPVSRRGFLRGLGGSLATAAISGGLIAARPDGEEAEAAAPKDGEVIKGATPVTLTVNGVKRTATVDPRRTLLEMLRTDFDLTGTKLVCNQGTCGACTVVMDGRTVYSCLTLALDADGKKVETVEGLAKGDKFHPLQTAFVEHDALMCGFCTPGFLMSSKALLDKNNRPTLDDVKTACAGNICRCGTYPRIFDAVLDAAKKV
jgi:aerobic-type carbon monoxide dehydrogenase small subunit (CoxS/CutS family)